jgi:hypothetical protein
MNNKISFNYVPLILKKDDAIKILKEFNFDTKLPKLNQVAFVNFPSKNDSPIRSIEISKPTKQLIYNFKFISGEINLNPETNLPDKVPFFRNHTKWLTVIPGVWNELKKEIQPYIDTLLKSEINKNKTEMDILIERYSYSYIRAINKQGHNYVDPKENQLWIDNSKVPLQSLIS